MLTNLSVEQSLMKAKSYADKGEVAEAQKLYETILQKFSNNIRAQQGLAALNRPVQNNVIQHPPQEVVNQLVNLYNQGQFQIVFEKTQTLLKQSPMVFIFWNLLGVSASHMGKNDVAIKAFKNALILNSNFAETYFNMGIVLRYQDKVDEAIDAYKKAISLKPDYAAAYNNMGMAFKDQDKLDEAIKAFRKSVSLEPDDAHTYFNMGITLKIKVSLTRQ